ncbi:Kef-type K+ transport system putative NAD-binding component [Rhodovulum sp. P5]|uniref:ion channel n=1 Tax=Rhodovulum sp. P5 TaxID=1564506 RepID=UPI0009C2BC1E|nr:ion channel [Rhodovulum sp. P5]ARE41773.1 Kef-type K+ transport system putative NAD-binding component [Rhodovulum sp. P5]
MLIQIVLGSILILLTIIVFALGFWFAETAITRFNPWLVRRPHPPKLVLVLVAAVLVLLSAMTASVWLWAYAFLLLGIFPSLEPAAYFALVAFTTLGFGDILLPIEWRILGGMAAANGLLNIGLYTALLVEALRRVRSEQVSGIVDER